MVMKKYEPDFYCIIIAVVLQECLGRDEKGTRCLGQSFLPMYRSLCDMI